MNNKSNTEKDKFKYRSKGQNKEKINWNNGKDISKMRKKGLANIRKMKKKNYSYKEDFYMKEKMI